MPLPLCQVAPPVRLLDGQTVEQLIARHGPFSEAEIAELHRMAATPALPPKTQVHECFNFGHANSSGWRAKPHTEDVIEVAGGWQREIRQWVHIYNLGWDQMVQRVGPVCETSEEVAAYAVRGMLASCPEVA